MSDAKVDASSVGGRDGTTEVDLRFHKRAECLVLSEQVKETLHRWASGNLEAFRSQNVRCSGLAIKIIVVSARRQFRKRRAVG